MQPDTLELAEPKILQANAPLPSPINPAGGKYVAATQPAAIKPARAEMSQAKAVLPAAINPAGGKFVFKGRASAP